MGHKLSVALLEAFCALGFVVCGVVLGFCFGGLIGPRLFSHGGQGLEEIGAMLNGAILGMRKTEILELRWEQVDLEQGEIHLSAHDTKAEEARIVVLTERLLSGLSTTFEALALILASVGLYGP